MRGGAAALPASARFCSAMYQRHCTHSGLSLGTAVQQVALQAGDGTGIPVGLQWVLPSGAAQQRKGRRQGASGRTQTYCKGSSVRCSGPGEGGRQWRSAAQGMPCSQRQVADTCLPACLKRLSAATAACLCVPPSLLMHVCQPATSAAVPPPCLQPALLLTPPSQTNSCLSIKGWC